MKHAAILVVDDNPDHLELTTMALGECCDPGEVATATDGVEALDYLFGRGTFATRDTSQQPRLVILDMKLVRLHGLDVLKAVRQDPRTATIPVVMHSSSTEKGDIAACYANDCWPSCRSIPLSPGRRKKISSNASCSASRTGGCPATRSGTG